MTDLATAYANAGKALLDLADALTAEPEWGKAGNPFGQPPNRPQDAPQDPLPFEDTPQARSAQGGCAIHDVPWVIRPAGTSKKTGAPYLAFWHCNEQDSDGTYCREKPTAAWVKAHPPA